MALPDGIDALLALAARRASGSQGRRYRKPQAFKPSRRDRDVGRRREFTGGRGELRFHGRPEETAGNCGFLAGGRVVDRIGRAARLGSSRDSNSAAARSREYLITKISQRVSPLISQHQKRDDRPNTRKDSTKAGLRHGEEDRMARAARWPPLCLCGLRLFLHQTCKHDHVYRNRLTIRARDRLECRPEASTSWICAARAGDEGDGGVRRRERGRPECRHLGDRKTKKVAARGRGEEHGGVAVQTLTTRR